MFEPKFKVGDLVTTNTEKFSRAYTVDRARRGTADYDLTAKGARITAADYDLTVVGTNVRDFAYEDSLRLLTPEERTKLLLGIDLTE